MTLVGHSYGSTVSGIAAENGLCRADDLVVFGSPGVGSGEKVMGVDHVFALEADGDPIRFVSGVLGSGSPMGDPALDFMTLETDAHGDLKGVEGHSDYLKEDTTSQHNIAKVVAGARDEAIRISK